MDFERIRNFNNLSRREQFALLAEHLVSRTTHSAQKGLEEALLDAGIISLEKDPETGEDFMLVKKPYSPKIFAEMFFSKINFPADALGSVYTWLRDNRVRFEAKDKAGDYYFLDCSADYMPFFLSQNIPVIRKGPDSCGLIALFDQGSRKLKKYDRDNSAEPYTFKFEEYQKEVLRETFAAVINSGHSIEIPTHYNKEQGIIINAETSFGNIRISNFSVGDESGWEARDPGSLFRFFCKGEDSFDEPAFAGRAADWPECKGLSENELKAFAREVHEKRVKAESLLNKVASKYKFDRELYDMEGFALIGASCSSFSARDVLVRTHEPPFMPDNAVCYIDLSKELSFNTSALNGPFRLNDFIDTHFEDELENPSDIGVLFHDGQIYFTEEFAQKVREKYASVTRENAFTGAKESVAQALAAGLSVEELKELIDTVAHSLPDQEHDISAAKAGFEEKTVTCADKINDAVSRASEAAKLSYGNTVKQEHEH